MIYENAKLIKKTKLKENVFSFLLNCKEIEKKATPGQFANILVESFTLRRPFSICEIEKDQINIVFNVKGKGTKKMASWQEGKSVNIIAPLGKGFAPLKKEEKIFCEISLEERMACGIGACLCCQHILNENSNKKIVHVCKDGPVFKVFP